MVDPWQLNGGPSFPSFSRTLSPVWWRHRAICFHRPTGGGQTQRQKGRNCGVLVGGGGGGGWVVVEPELPTTTTTPDGPSPLAAAAPGRRRPFSSRSPSQTSSSHRLYAPEDCGVPGGQLDRAATNLCPLSGLCRPLLSAGRARAVFNLLAVSVVESRPEFVSVSQYGAAAGAAVGKSRPLGGDWWTLAVPLFLPHRRLSQVGPIT
ncbi:hypothetical protein TYRP_022883 [Tyrophagus putrescentiae]|nr:hypothetical protein TYRP_022883 [Tyrophagus putrescentiae]